MQSAEVVWSQDARLDLLEIYTYILDSGSPRGTLRFAGEIEERANAVADLPFAGRVRDDLGPHLRSIPFKSAVILYSLEKDRVLIARIIHGARDIAALMRPI